MNGCVKEASFWSVELLFFLYLLLLSAAMVAAALNFFVLVTVLLFVGCWNGKMKGGKRDKGKKGLIYHVYPSEHNTRTSPWPPLLPSVCNSVKKTEGFSHSFYKWGGKITVFFVFYPSRKNECPLFRAATLPGGWSWLRLKKITIPSNSCC